ncbi:MAG: hypothetical protein ACRDOO_14815 [Actinomadura sp.]
MPAPGDIPAALSKGPFRVDEAARFGVTHRRLAGKRFRRIFHRVYVSADVPDSVELRCQAALLLVPHGAVFCGTTAARLYGVPLAETDTDVHLALPPGTTPLPRIQGIALHRYRLTLDQIRRVRGFHAVRPERLFVELAAELDRLGLVIAGDHLLGRGWTDLDTLARSVAACGQRPGIALARAALPHLEPKTDSPMETRLRMIIVDAGLPRPVANRDAFGPGGIWIARPDLAYPDSKIAIDYEGAHHRMDARQYRSDLIRDDQLAVNGWIHLKYDAAAVFRTPTRIVSDIDDALRRRRVTPP